MMNDTMKVKAIKAILEDAYMRDGEIRTEYWEGIADAVFAVIEMEEGNRETDT